MFEVGLQAYENQTFAAGGLNMTHEKQIMDSLLEWYEAGGGQLKYAKPVFAGPLIGYELRATESVLPDEAVVVMPLKLMICRVTARNVVIKHKHSYLGEGLRKTFAKNEKWGLALFLLHEWFKERHSGGSKWGPFLRSLAMRQLSTPVLRELMGSQVPSINVDISEMQMPCTGTPWKQLVPAESPRGFARPTRTTNSTTHNSKCSISAGLSQLSRSTLCAFVTLPPEVPFWL